ncbi:alpha/beta fold hydrolase [Natronorarus salvus]|uniref:alpha/beta fold hydrolase n=1 Tax=Natronorarus salvus TaxID=3117733 RepID=UPI002F26D2B9
MTDGVSSPRDFEHSVHEAINAGFVWLEFEGEKYRTYYETAGNGDIPLVLLHTASADSRQYRHIMNNERLHEDFTFYAFDMPWHGKTLPPMTREWWTEDYRLTTDFYAGFIMTFVSALDLDQPGIVGCSMGGAIVLELANSYADDLRAVVALESTAHAPTRDIGYLDHPHINQEVVRPEWTYGLQAPQSPEQFKRESWWHYTQGGHDVYVGDLHFYTEDWDIRDELGDIDTDECSVYLLTGEYDFSASPEDTREVAEQIAGAEFHIMKEMGHFPMVENPGLFNEYFYPILEKVKND